jgi:hypothetical protein
MLDEVDSIDSDLTPCYSVLWQDTRATARKVNVDALGRSVLVGLRGEDFMPLGRKQPNPK